MYEKLLREVVKIAKDASVMIEASIHHAEFTLKKDRSYVSQVDIDVEKYISSALKSIEPSIPVYGEELGSDGILQDDVFWLIDPIDGTAWYRIGVPIYGSLISLIKNGEPVLGCISLPGMDKFCYAAQGVGCFVDTSSSEKIEALVNTSPMNIKNAVITASGIHGTSIWLENGTTPWRLDRIYKEAKLFKLSGDCVQHVQVVCGKIDAAIDTIMKPWDSAALIICLREAGATVMDLEGNEERLIYSESLISASSRALALEIITNISPDNFV
jgi:histidinol-phosphatase